MRNVLHRKQRGSDRKRRGAAAVEMAFVLPVFITVVLGIIELGRGMMIGQLVTNAAREATRLAIIDGCTDSQVTTAAKSSLNSTAGVSTGSVSVSISVTGAGSSVSTAQPRDLISVTVSVPYSAVSWLPPKYMAGKNVSATCAMRHE
jgi:Flp pilus assembly protein TadG